MCILSALQELGWRFFTATVMGSSFFSHLFWPNPFNCWSFLQSLLLILPYAVVLRNIVVQFGGGCVGNVITGGSWSSHCVPGESGQCGRLSWPPGVRPHLSLLQQDTTDWENPTMHSIHPQIVDKDGRRKFDHQKMGGSSGDPTMTQCPGQSRPAEHFIPRTGTYPCIHFWQLTNYYLFSTIFPIMLCTRNYIRMCLVLCESVWVCVHSCIHACASFNVLTLF